MPHLTIEDCPDLLTHSAALEELREQGELLAGMVSAIRDAAGLLPPELRRLAEKAARRPSVQRRLVEQDGDVR